jgi:hypothetical protein
MIIGVEIFGMESIKKKHSYFAINSNKSLKGITNFVNEKELLL